MKRKTAAILSVLSCLILFVSAAQAWILTKEPLYVRHIAVDYGSGSGGSLSIAAFRSVTMEVLFEDPATGEYLPQAEDTPALFSGLVPNASVKFRLRIRNSSDQYQRASLSLGGIRDGAGTEAPSLIRKMYVDLTAGDGYRDGSARDVNAEIPEPVFRCLGDGLPDDSSPGALTLPLYGSLLIPPTGETGYVELQGFFWLDHGAGPEYMETGMTAEYFRLVV